MSISPIPGRTTAPIPSSTLLGYQAEGARTNLCLQSNAFTTAPWADYSGTLTIAQDAIGPDGATSAWTATDDGGATEGRFQSISLTNASVYTCSIFVGKTTGTPASYPSLEIETGTSVWGCCINTTAGTATAITTYSTLTPIAPSAIRVNSFNDDFWRVEFTFTATSTAAYLFSWITAFNTTGTGVLSAAATGSAVFYGAQVELGSFASSYIPTTTAAVTRNADVLTYSSAGNILGTAGWCYAEFSTYAANAAQYSGVVGTIDAGGGSPLMLNVGALKPMIYDGTTLTVVTGNSVTANVLSKAVSTWGGSTMSVCLAGSTVVSGAFDGEIGYTTTNGIGIGTRTTAGANILNGNIKNVRIGQRQLSASELQAITA